MVRPGLSYGDMADVHVGVGRFSRTRRPLATAQIGRILQCLGLSRKLLGSDQTCVAV